MDENQPGIFGESPRRPRNSISKTLGITIVVLIVLAFALGPNIGSFFFSTNNHVLLETNSDEFEIDTSSMMSIEVAIDIGSIVITTHGSSNVDYTLETYGERLSNVNEADEVEISGNTLIFEQTSTTLETEFSYELSITLPRAIPEIEMILSTSVGNIVLELGLFDDQVSIETQSSVGSITIELGESEIRTLQAITTTGDINLEMEDTILGVNGLLETTTGDIFFDAVEIGLNSDRTMNLITTTGSILSYFEQQTLDANLTINADVTTGSFEAEILRSTFIGTQYTISSSLGSEDHPGENNIFPKLIFVANTGVGSIEISEEIL